MCAHSNQEIKSISFICMTSMMYLQYCQSIKEKQHGRKHLVYCKFSVCPCREIEAREQKLYNTFDCADKTVNDLRRRTSET